ncbi:MAG: arginase family protein, partial [Deltaproteobacteria bacterium]
QETPFNHACVARRISELCPIVQVGIRSLSVEEADFLKDAPRGRLKTFYADAVMAQGASKAAQAAAKALTEDVFITVDLDVFDPSIMPATGTPEPGGLLWRDALDVLRTVASKKRVVGFDVVELCPMPGNVAPDFMAAKLVYKLMGYINARIDRPKARGRQGGIPPLFKGGVRGG